MPSSPETQLSGEDELREVWKAWRSGATIRCHGDGAPIALVVESTVGTYRFVCTHCGNSSPWFEATLTGMRIRNSLSESGAHASVRDK